MIELADGPYTMILDPGCGGSVRSLRWLGRPIFREQLLPGVLESASFAMVPFCNRIAGNHFIFGSRSVRLTPNHPTQPGEPVLHGFGWTRAWSVDSVEAAAARLVLDFEHRNWPWPFQAVQEFALTAGGIDMRLSLENLADEPMPAGLGFHPFFLRHGDTIFHGLHASERQADGSFLSREGPVDWWHGRPVGERIVDTTYTRRVGELTIAWPAAGVGLSIRPCGDLPHTHVYVPRGTSFFCVEPVSHLPDAVNAAAPGARMRVLAPGECWMVAMRLRAYAVSAP